MAHEAILCDLGGVVVDVESDRLMHQIAQLLGRPFEEVQAAVYDPELLLPFELGRITPEGYFQGLRERLALPWSFAQFLQAWNGIFTENRDVTRLLQELGTRHRLIALTNTNVLHLEHIRASFPSLGVFEHWIASCDVGLRKPDPAMYAHALRHLGIEASAVIYVDDRPEMVEAGRQAGLTAIRCEHGRQLAQALRDVGAL
jgi:putative hydrolase of the HAD superfamily